MSFPERWRWLDRTFPDWPGAVTGVVSTAPCPPDLIESLVRRGLAGMTEVYGSSETCGVALRDWPERDYRLMPHWRFADESEAGHPMLHHRSGVRMPLMDRIEPRGDDRFRLTGRLDGIVQVGGTNVQPRWVEERLRGRPGVGEVAVRLMRPEEGRRLKAYVVPAPSVDTELLERDLGAWIETHLPVGGATDLADLRIEAADQRLGQGVGLVASPPVAYRRRQPGSVSPALHTIDA